MRVAIFFDGKNFYEGMEHTLSAERRFLNYRSLALWLVQRVGGTELAGAHYYTGVPAQLVRTVGRTSTPCTHFTTECFSICTLHCHRATDIA